MTVALYAIQKWTLQIISSSLELLGVINHCDSIMEWGTKQSYDYQVEYLTEIRDILNKYMYTISLNSLNIQI